MRAALKIIGVGIGVIFLVGFGAGLWLWATDFTSLRPVIVSQIEKILGRQVSAERLKITPGLRPIIVVENVAVSNAEWGTRSEMLRMKRLEVQLQILPLLDGNVWIDRLILVQPDILLEASDDRANWRFHEGSADPSILVEESPQTGPSEDVAPFALRKVVIRDGIVTYRTPSTGVSTDVVVTVEEFGWDARATTERLAISGAGSFRGRDWDVSGTVGTIADFLNRGDAYPVDLSGRLGGMDVRLQGSFDGGDGSERNAMTVSLQGQSLAKVGDLMNVQLPSLGPFALAGQISKTPGGYAIRSFHADAGDASLDGSATIALNGAVPQIARKLNSDRLDLAPFLPPREQAEATPSPGKILRELMIPAGSLSGYGAQVEALVGELLFRDFRFSDVSLSGSVRDGAATIDLASFAIAGGRVSARGSLRPGDPTLADMTLDFDSIQLDRLIGSGDAAAETTPGEKSVATGNSGSIELKMSAGDEPTLIASLTSQRLDLTPILPADDAASDMPKRESLFSDAPFAFRMIEGYEADLRVRVSELIARDFRLRDVAIESRLENGRLSIDPINLRFADGEVQGSGTLNSAASTADVAMSLRSEGLNVANLLGTFGAGEQLTGDAALTLDLRSEGQSPAALMADLGGSASLVLRKGRILDTRLNLLIADLDFLNLISPFSRGSDFIEVDCLVGGLRFDGGVGASTVLLDTPEMTLIGDGHVDLGGETIDLTLRPRAKTQKLSITHIPVRVHGSLTSPQIEPFELKRNAAKSFLGGLALPLNFLSKYVGQTGNSVSACGNAIRDVQNAPELNDPSANGETAQP